MFKQLKLVAGVSVTATLVACGGGGGGGSAAIVVPPNPVVCTAPAVNQNDFCVTPPATAITAALPAGSQPWFHNYLKNSDGSETLVLTTVGE